ncbi:MAG: ferrochelatase [Ilumatobacteraceae bacterium]
MSDTPSTAVLVMAYGTPRHHDEIEPYYTDIRRGRPPTPEALADLTARYDAIGGVSPLAALTEAQRDALQAALDAIAPDRYRVAIGLKHAHPMIEETVTELIAAGHRRIVGLVLAPHYSAYSVGQYLDRARAAAEPHGVEPPVEIVGIESWATEPALIDFLAADLRHRLATMPANTKVVFTAHSLPRRIIDAGDPYPDELRATAEAVARVADLREWSQWSIAWQSAGRTPEPWIGPDVLAVIDDLAAADAADGVIVSACGFVADHLEVLYDLDIEARRRAESLGLAFDRTACVNDDPAVMTALAERVVELDTGER